MAMVVKQDSSEVQRFANSTTRNANAANNLAVPQKNASEETIVASSLAIRIRYHSV